MKGILPLEEVLPYAKKPNIYGVLGFHKEEYRNKRSKTPKALGKIALSTFGAKEL